MDGARRSLFDDLGADALGGMQERGVELVEHDASDRQVEDDDRDAEDDGEHDRVPGREARLVPEPHQSPVTPT